MKYLVTERLKLKDLYPERAKDLAKESEVDVDDLELVRKGVIADKTETDEEGVISFISMEGPDRDNEEMDPDGVILTFFNKNKVVPYGHDYRGLPVGKSMWIKKVTKNGKKGLLAKTVFLKHNFAQEVGKLYTEDVAGTGPAMKGWSIGFIPLKWQEPEEKEKPPKEGEADTRPRRKYTKWELVEYSAVMIPSCREALTEMVEKGLIKDARLKKDIAELIEIEDDPEERHVTIMTEEDLLSEVIKHEEIVEYVCPQCEGELGVDGDGSYCKQCEWTHLDSKKEPVLILRRVITKPEENDNEIRIPAKGEEGKHKKHAIRWMIVSAKKGIKGLYCIDCKKIITYVFDKKKGWTMAKALKWMKDNGKHIDDLIALWNENMPDEKDEYLKELFDTYLDSEEVIELEDEIKGVIPFRDTPKAPENAPWNGPREIKDAEISDLKIMCTWFNAENPDIKGAYKLPHHQVKGHKVVWRAAAAAMAALLGARGGIQLPDKDRKGVYNHLAKEYKKFDKKPPEFREYTEEELKELFPDEITIKRPDLQGNPSIWDILDAIEGTINAGVIGPRKKWVADLYPVKYPSGNVVIGVREQEMKYYLYPYTYEDGDITFGEATELEQTYKPSKGNDQKLMDEIFEKRTDGRIRLTEEVAKRVKEDFKENMDENGIGKVTQELWNSVVDQLKESDVAEEIAKEALLELHQIREEIKSLKEGRVLSAKNRKLIQDILTAIEAAIPPLKSLLTATEPPKEEEFEIDIDKDEGTDNEGKDAKGKPEKLEIDTEQLTAIVQGVFQNNLDKIGELVADKMAKAQGKVG